MAGLVTAQLASARLSEDAAAAIAVFVSLHPIAAGLCGFALMAVLAAGVRAFMRRTAKREAWQIIAEDHETRRQGDAAETLTYRDAVRRQFSGD